MNQYSTRNEFGMLFMEHFKTGLGAEVGVQRGYFSMQILKHWRGDLLCVDIWENEEEFEEAKNVLPSNAILLKGNSIEVASTIDNNALDFVYIDADHRFENVMADLVAWFDKVRTGGIISGHDYCRYFEYFGVIEAVNKFCSERSYTFMLTTDDFWEGHPFPSWYFRK